MSRRARAVRLSFVRAAQWPLVRARFSLPRLALLVALLVPASARAGLFDDAQGTAWLHYELSAFRARDSIDDAPRDLVLAGVRLHGIFGGRFGYHAGLDLAAGSAIDPAGLAYDVALFPVGGGLRFGRTGVLAVGAGVGAVGAVGALDDAATFPLEATLELGGAVRLLARARVAFVAGGHGGAPNAPFGDQLDTTLAVRLGHAWHDWGFLSGGGYFAGVAYRELAGARFVGLTIGYAIDGASPPRH